MTTIIDSENVWVYIFTGALSVGLSTVWTDVLTKHYNETIEYLGYTDSTSIRFYYAMAITTLAVLIVRMIRTMTS